MSSREQEISAMCLKKTPVVIIGLGFVGLSCFTGLKELGYNVIGIENNPLRIAEIKDLSTDSIEKDICEILSLKSHYVNEIFSSIDEIDLSADKIVILICVGTPELLSGRTDTSHILDSIEQVYSKLKDTKIEFVIKSTVPPGTCDSVITPYIKNLFGDNAWCVSNPEFLREGYALVDFLEPDRIIVGRDFNNASLIEKLYGSEFENVMVCNTKTAEFSKYFSNTALSTMISFSNEMRLFSEKIENINIKMVFDQFGMDRRWKDSSMKNYFWPGIGFGGYCLPKDTLSISRVMSDAGFESRMMTSVLDTNNSLIEFFSDKIQDFRHETGRIIFLGSSFKVGSDDIRNSKTVELVRNLNNRNIKNLCILKDSSSHNVTKGNNFLTEITETEICENDLLVIVLRDKAYKPIIKRHPRENVLDIPLLNDLA